MDFKALQAFRAFLAEGNVTAAARRLDVGQPHVSRLLAALERQTGMALFTRRAGRLLPTEEALLFHAEVDRALGAVEELGTVARSLASGGTGRRARLRVLVQSHLAHGLMPRVVARLAAEAPPIRLDLDIRQRHRATAWAERRAFDAAITALPMEVRGAQFLPLFNSAMCVGVARGHRLAGEPNVTMEKLAAHPIIALRPGLPNRDRLDRAARALGLRLRIACETSSSLSALQIAAEGVGAAVVDPFVAHAMAADARLCIRPLTPTIAVTYALAVPGTEGITTAIDRLRRAMIEEAAIVHAWIEGAETRSP